MIIAENNRKIADLAFAQQAITTTTNTITAYWELAYARENVKVQQQAVTVSEKLYSDNKKQLDIGTMAPLDVTRAESELATDRQNLIVAQTTQLQDELVLKNYISKDPLASNLISVEIIPTDKPVAPEAIQTLSFEDAVKEAFAKRPDVQEQYFNLKSADVDVRATKNALLPTATLGAYYSSSGLAGNSPTYGTPVPGLGTQLVDGTGTPVDYYIPEATAPVTGTFKQGLGTAQSQIFHNDFPTYAAQLTLSLPLRNRAAQADSVHAQLVKRQFEAQVQQIKNNALLDVRNTTIALEQGRAQVQAASKARELQQQTFDAEQKKYQLGASTVYNVILTQRDLITAQGTELRALANLAEAKANYERALGRTLDVNSVTIAGAEKGVIENDTLIPGTHNGQVAGTEKLFKALDDAAPTASANLECGGSPPLLRPKLRATNPVPHPFRGEAVHNPGKTCPSVLALLHSSTLSLFYFFIFLCRVPEVPLLYPVLGFSYSRLRPIRQYCHPDRSAALYAASPQLSSRPERRRFLPSRSGGIAAPSQPFGVFPPHASAPMILRVPRPCFLRVGSYDRTPQTLSSSLLCALCVLCGEYSFSYLALSVSSVVSLSLLLNCNP